MRLHEVLQPRHVPQRRVKHREHPLVEHAEHGCRGVRRSHGAVHLRRVLLDAAARLAHLGEFQPLVRHRPELLFEVGQLLALDAKFLNGVLGTVVSRLNMPFHHGKLLLPSSLQRLQLRAVFCVRRGGHGCDRKTAGAVAGAAAIAGAGASIARTVVCGARPRTD